jgi:hypothetical protein
MVVGKPIPNDGQAESCLREASKVTAVGAVVYVRGALRKSDAGIHKFVARSNVGTGIVQRVKGEIAERCVAGPRRVSPVAQS